MEDARLILSALALAVLLAATPIDALPRAPLIASVPALVALEPKAASVPAAPAACSWLLP